MSLHKHKVLKRKEEIDKAFEQFNEALKHSPNDVGIAFKDGDIEIIIPKAYTDLVKALNPADSKKQEAITKELFKGED